MKKCTLAIAIAGLVSASAAAQTPSRADLTSLGRTKVTHLGTFHAATGQMTPPGRGLDGPTGDPIYNNSAFTGNLGNLIGGRTYFDEGRIPSPTSVGVVGTQSNYSISSFEFGYATDATDITLGGTGVTFRIDFYDSWAVCDTPFAAPAPIFSTVVGPLGASTIGAIQAFMLDVDTTAMGFCIQADGDGTYVDGVSDLFGWSIVAIDAGDGTVIGPLTAGGRGSGAVEGDGTVFQNPTFPGSGLSSVDSFTLVEPMGLATCTTFGGTPSASFYMVLRGDVTTECIIGTDLCDGVVNSTGDGAILRSSGSDLASDNALQLTTTGLPANSMGYYLVSRDSNVVMNPGGSTGSLCISSTSFGRYAAAVLDSGAAGVVTFSPDLAAIPLATAGGTSTTAVMAGDTFNFQFWYRDVDGMGGATSNFSSATSVTFQ